MEEKRLEILAVVVSLIGVFLILFVSEKIEAKEFHITDINESLIGKEVKAGGKVLNIIETDGLVIFDLEDKSGKIKVVAFKDDYIEVYEEDKVEVVGEVTEYKGEFEIEAKIIKLR